MKVFELLEFNRISLKLMKDNGIKLNDVEYLSLYEDYSQMKDRHYKVSYIVAHLSEKYSISVRQVYTLVKRLGSGCKTDAVKKDSALPLP